MGTGKKVAVGGGIPSVAGRKPQYGEGLPLSLSMKEMAYGYRQDLSGRTAAAAEEYVAGDRHGICGLGRANNSRGAWECGEL